VGRLRLGPRVVGRLVPVFKLNHVRVVSKRVNLWYTRLRHSYNGILPYSTVLFRMTLSDLAKAKYSMTQSIARPLCYR